MATLLRLQLESGNFPSSEGSLRDVLVQFCHGAPGFLISFHSVKNAFPDLEAEIAVATERAEECVDTRGATKDTLLLSRIAWECVGRERGKYDEDAEDCVRARYSVG
jgi:hypothetical protein